MAVASLIISIVAVLMAGISVWFTRSQAESARATHRLEEERRFDEMAPDLKAGLENVGGWWRLTLMLATPRALSFCEVHIVHGGLRFTTEQEGVSRSDRTIAEFGVMQPGGMAARRVELTQEGSREVQLRIECRGGQPWHWTITRTVTLPGWARWAAEAEGQPPSP